MGIYIGSDGWLAVIFIYLPVTGSIIWMLYSALTKLDLKIEAKLVTICSLVIVAAMILFAEVIMIGHQSKQLCKNAGMHVYKTVKANSIYGKHTKTLLSRPGSNFDFVEETSFDKTYRYYISNGIVKKELIESPASRYWSIQDDKYVHKKIKQERTYVIDTLTNESLGELLNYRIYPGWYESLFINQDEDVGRCFTGLSTGQVDLITKIFIPANY
ncbi:MAG: hypothetical protein AAF304_05280 [Pseudomonadota bacterium]